MAGLPTITVEVYSVSITAWTDVSAYVLRGEGIRWSRGRSNEFDTSSPGKASFTMDNREGDWTPGTGFAFDALGYVRINNRVRIKVGATQVWQGRIDSFAVVPGSGGGRGASVVKVECTDDFKVLARTPFASYGVEEAFDTISAHTAGAMYPIAAKPNTVGAMFAAHRDPAASPLSIVGSTRGSWTTGDDGPPFVGRCLNFVEEEGAAYGPAAVHPYTFNPGADYAVVGAWFRTTKADAASYIFRLDRSSGGSGYLHARIDATTGKLTVAGAGDSSGTLSYTSTIDNLFDGVWHHLAVKVSPTTGTTCAVYLDGALLSSPTSGGTALTIGSTNRRLLFGSSSVGGGNYGLCMQSIALPFMFSHTSAITGSDSGYADGWDGDSGDAISTRLSNLDNYAGLGSISYSDASAITLAGQDLYGKSMLDAVQQVAETEHGVFYMNRTGGMRFRGFSARSSGSSVVLTLDAQDDITSDIEFTANDSTYCNTVVVTSAEGSAVAQDATALADDDGEEIIDKFDCVADAASLQDVADRRLSLRKYAGLRLPRVTVDLLTSPNSIASTTIQLVPLDRVSITGLDSTTFGATSWDGFMEGASYEVTNNSYTATLDLSPVI